MLGGVATAAASSVGGETHICIAGRNVLMRSNAYWHFAQGHMMETFVMLQSLGLYSPRVRLSFGDRDFFSSWRRFLPFYTALFDELPTLDRDCKHAQGRVLTFPGFWMGPSKKGPVTAFKEAANSSMMRACAWLPVMHSIAASRRRIKSRSARKMRIVLLERPNVSAASGPGRRILNNEHISAELGKLARSQGADFFHGNIESWRPMAQVDLLLETDILLSYHGSGVGSGHFWMPPGSMVVEFQPPGVPYCIFAACGAASGKAWIESADAATPQMEIWKPGGWNSKWYICDPKRPGRECHRTVDIQPALHVIRAVLRGGGRAPRWQKRGLVSSAALSSPASPQPAAEWVSAMEAFANRSCGRKEVHGCSRSCGRRVVQVWESSRRCHASERRQAGGHTSAAAGGLRRERTCSISVDEEMHRTATQLHALRNASHGVPYAHSTPLHLRLLGGAKSASAGVKARPSSWAEVLSLASQMLNGTSPDGVRVVDRQGDRLLDLDVVEPGQVLYVARRDGFSG